MYSSNYEPRSPECIVIQDDELPLHKSGKLRSYDPDCPQYSDDEEKPRHKPISKRRRPAPYLRNRRNRLDEMNSRSYRTSTYGITEEDGKNFKEWLITQKVGELYQLMRQEDVNTITQFGSLTNGRANAIAYQQRLDRATHQLLLDAIRNTKKNLSNAYKNSPPRNSPPRNSFPQNSFPQNSPPRISPRILARKPSPQKPSPRKPSPRKPSPRKPSRPSPSPRNNRNSKAQRLKMMEQMLTQNAQKKHSSRNSPPPNNRHSRVFKGTTTENDGTNVFKGKTFNSPPPNNPHSKSHRLKMMEQMLTQNAQKKKKIVLRKAIIDDETEILKKDIQSLESEKIAISNNIGKLNARLDQIESELKIKKERLKAETTPNFDDLDEDDRDVIATMLNRKRPVTVIANKLRKDENLIQSYINSLQKKKAEAIDIYKETSYNHMETA